MRVFHFVSFLCSICFIYVSAYTNMQRQIHVLNLKLQVSITLEWLVSDRLTTEHVLLLKFSNPHNSRAYHMLLLCFNIKSLYIYICKVRGTLQKMLLVSGFEPKPPERNVWMRFTVAHNTVLHPISSCCLYVAHKLSQLLTFASLRGVPKWNLLFRNYQHQHTILMEFLIWY
jgi:hypothetical protein